MDLNLTGEAIGSVGGTAGFLGLVKTFYNDYRTWIEKRDARKELAEILQSIEKRLDEQDEGLASHSLLDAQTYATRDDMRKLFDHIDRKLDAMQVASSSQISNLQNMVIGVIKEGNHRDS